MNLENYTIKAQDALTSAQQSVVELGQQHLEPEHVLAAMLDDNEGLAGVILNKIGIDLPGVQTPLKQHIDKFPRVYGTPGQVYASPNFNQMITFASKEAKELKDEYISTEHLLLGILEVKRTEASKILASAGASRDMILKALVEIRGKQRVTDQNVRW